MKKFLLLSGAVFLLAGLLQAAQKAPAFRLNDLSGQPVSLASYKGKVVAVNFWASWCPPCKAELPDLEKTYRELKSRGFVIIGVAVASNEDDVKDLVRQDNLTYPIVMSNGSVEDLFGGIRFTPTTFVIDRRGDIVKKKIGMFMEGELGRLVEPLLKNGKTASGGK